MTYGRKALHEIKRKKGFTQIELGEALGTSQTNISNFLNGKVPISEPMARKISELFGYDYNMIMSQEPNVSELKTKNNPRIDTLNIPEGIEVDIEEVHSVQVVVIPIKGQAGLQSNYYDDLLFSDLETEELLTTEKHVGKYFKIEVSGDSMDDGTAKSLQRGDWAYCRALPKIHWREKLHTHKWRIWCFFHNERGIIFKSIDSHDIETGEMELSSINPDKELYPNFKINIGECSYVCNVVKKLTPM